MPADGGARERRVVTALFCDVVGSTSIAESMDPEEWSEIVNEAIALMSRSVERFDGTVAQFAGDGILALFGAPIAHEDDPYRALRAAFAMVESVGRTGLDVRVGVHTGLVVAGDIDAGDLSLYSALGDTLNVASRLQTVAEPGEVMVSGETAALVSQDVETESLGRVNLKGRSEAVPVFRVVAVRGTEERRRGIAGLTSPMLGRDAEHEVLRNLVAAARAGSGRVAAILGEPGVGKSRLVEELAHDVRGFESARWAVGHCVPYDEDLPFNLIASLVRSLAGVTASDDPELVTKSVTRIGEVAGRPDVTEPLLELLGVTEPAPGDGPEQLQSRYAEAVYALVSGLCEEHRPVVLVCEDAHWADRSSVDLMAGLLDRAPSTPVLLLFAMRPERDSEGWALLARAREVLGETLTEIRLAPLGPDDSRRLVENLLVVESLPGHLRNMVLQKAEGNPFFLEEVVRMLIERGLVEERDGRWLATGGVADLDVPATVHSLLASRIDLLPADVRRAGRVAAVIGRRFPASLLAAVHPAGRREATLHPHIAALEARGMVRLVATRPEVEFAFRHALIHDVMYEGLLKRERRALHRSVAEAIEAAHAERLDDHAPALARHWVEAGEAERAMRHLLVAGRSAMSRGARPEAHRFFGQAVELSDPDDPATMIDAVLGKAGSGMTFVPVPDTIALLEDCLPVAEVLGDADRLASVYVQILVARNMQGESYVTHPYREQLEAAYRLAPRVSDPARRALIQGMMGFAHRSADEYAESIAPLTEAVEELESAGRFAEASLHASMLADSHTTIGSFDEAQAVIERARRLGEASGDPNAVADADLIRGRIAADRGDLEEALAHTRAGLEAAEAIGNTFCSLAGNFMVADQQLRLGQVGEAITHLERSTGLAEFCNAGGYEALGQAWLAAARARLGALDLDAFAEPLAAAIASQSRSGEAQIRFHRAVALAGAGGPLDSLEDFAQAIELFAEYGALPSLARARHAHAQALEAVGRIDDAAAELREAEAIFERLGIDPDAVVAN